MALVVLLLLTISPLFASISADPVIIKTGIHDLKKTGESQNNNNFDAHNTKGIANYEGEEGFNRNEDHKLVKAEDSGAYNQAQGEKNLQANANNFADDRFRQQSGGSASDYDKKSATKKGHHKTGYTKSFHKDETGSSSSYYDDSDDEGGENVHNSRKHAYGDSGQQSQRGLDNSDRRYLQDNEKKGRFDTAGKYEKDLSDRRGYHGNKYYDSRENEGRRNAGNQYYGQDDRGHQEKYLRSRQPYYYDDYRPHQQYYDRQPVLYPQGSQQKITIYEDPRYDGYEKYPRYDSDYINLEVKRPTRDYDYGRYDKGAYPDYYY